MKTKELKNILFLNIATVSLRSSLDKISAVEKKFWKVKSKRFSADGRTLNGEDLNTSYLQKAGLFAEFSKVVCISVGYVFSKEGQADRLKVKSFYGHDEKIVLSQLCQLLISNSIVPKTHFFTGHNIKEFDVPFLARRMILHQIQLPEMFRISGKKPWQIRHLKDSMQMWRFGDWKNYTSLRLLAFALGLEMDNDHNGGAHLSEWYHLQNGLHKIVSHCEEDLVLAVQVFLKLHHLEPLPKGQIGYHTV